MLKYDLSWSTESLKTQKGQWQAIDRRRTDNPMAKINTDEKTTNDPENNTFKTKDWVASNSLTIAPVNVVGLTTQWHIRYL